MWATFRITLFFFLTNLPLFVNGQARNLDFYISKGLSNSPVLTDIRNQVGSVTIDSLLVTAARKPQIEGRSQFLYSPYAKNFGYDEAITDGGNYQAVAYVSQDIFAAKRVSNKYKALQIDRRSLNLSEKVTIAELKKSITDAYLEAYSAYSDLQFNISFLALLKGEAQVIRQLAESGSSSRTDYLSLMVETGGQEVIISQMKSRLRKDIMAMNALCGIVDTSSVVLGKPEFKMPDTVVSPGYIFTAQYYFDSLKLVNEREALALRYKPSVNWFADAGILASDPFTFFRHFGASAGVSLTVPIYDGHQRKLEENKLQIHENSRLNYLDITRRQYDQNLLGLMDEITGLNQTKSSLERQLKISEELMVSLRIQMENGIARMQDYIQAVKNYRSINHIIILTDIEILKVRNEINYILSK